MERKRYGEPPIVLASQEAALGTPGCTWPRGGQGVWVVGIVARRRLT